MSAITFVSKGYRFDVTRGLAGVLIKKRSEASSDASMFVPWDAIAPLADATRAFLDGHEREAKLAARKKELEGAFGLRAGAFAWLEEVHGFSVNPQAQVATRHYGLHADNVRLEGIRGFNERIKVSLALKDPGAEEREACVGFETYSTDKFAEIFGRAEVAVMSAFDTLGHNPAKETEPCKASNERPS